MMSEGIKREKQTDEEHNAYISGQLVDFFIVLRVVIVVFLRIVLMLCILTVFRGEWSNVLIGAETACISVASKRPTRGSEIERGSNWFVDPQERTVERTE